MKTGRRSAISLVLALALAPFVDAADVDIKVLVPVPVARVGKVQYGRQRIPASVSSDASPIVIILNTWLGKEDRMLDEVLEALKAETRSNMEVWLNGATAASTIRAAFREGWVGAILDKSERTTGSDSASAKGLVLFERDVLRLLLERFAGFGPVRVVWLDTSFWWLSYAWYVDDDISGLGEAGGLLGDSGIALFPVFIPTVTPQRREPEYRENDGASVFGTKVLFGSAIPGDAVRRALHDSESWSTLTIRIPAVAKQWKGRPKFLTVFENGSNRVLFRRRVAASGSRAAIRPSESRDMPASLCRIVKRKAIEAASLVPECGGLKTSQPSEAFLRLQGVRFDPDSPEIFEVSLSRTENGEQGTTGFYHRGHTATLKRLNEHTACVGPVPLRSSDIYLYSPSQQWIAAVRIRR